MKTFLIALSLVTSVFFNQAQAAPAYENPTVTAAFESRFGGASNAQWTELNGLFKVNFTFDGTVLNAYYNSEGSLIALTRQLSPATLPAALRASLSAEMNGRWISDLFVVETEKGKTWYVTLQSADEKVVLRSVQQRKWKQYQSGVAL
ncbi:hypothetical protein [Flaviaesturariibacter terrae]